jgi:hypothetical protein
MADLEIRSGVGDVMGIRVSKVFCALAIAAVPSSWFSPTAFAEPDGGSQPSCNWTLSRPFLVDVSGRTMVSATFSSLPCTGMLPNQQTACVELQGGGTAPICAHLAGYGSAQVYFAPYRPGSTYVSTGSGCGAVTVTLVSSCGSRGPLAATL